MFDETWCRESGELERDVRYLMLLRGIKGGVALRQRELRRLELLYGAGYRVNVERVLKEGWESPLLATPIPVADLSAGGRDAALAMVGRTR